jgi:hypothetical protein
MPQVEERADRQRPFVAIFPLPQLTSLEYQRGWGISSPNLHTLANNYVPTPNGQGQHHALLTEQLKDSVKFPTIQA